MKYPAPARFAARQLKRAKENALTAEQNARRKSWRGAGFRYGIRRGKFRGCGHGLYGNEHGEERGRGKRKRAYEKRVCPLPCRSCCGSANGRNVDMLLRYGEHNAVLSQVRLEKTRQDFLSELRL